MLSTAYNLGQQLALQNAGLLKIADLSDQNRDLLATALGATAGTAFGAIPPTALALILMKRHPQLAMKFFTRGIPTGAGIGALAGGELGHQYAISKHRSIRRILEENPALPTL